MTDELTELRHELVVGSVQEGKLVYPKNVGSAFKEDKNPYYRVKLNMYPGTTYYLVKNQGENPNYTLYSKIVEVDDELRFQGPVGMGRLHNDVKTHLEVRFNLIDRRIYMSLFPS